jgi:hypothetical protein
LSCLQYLNELGVFECLARAWRSREREVDLSCLQYLNELGVFECLARAWRLRAGG